MHLGRNNALGWLQQRAVEVTEGWVPAGQSGDDLSRTREGSGGPYQPGHKYPRV